MFSFAENFLLVLVQLQVPVVCKMGPGNKKEPIWAKTLLGLLNDALYPFTPQL